MGANTALKDAAELAEFMLKPSSVFGKMGASDTKIYNEAEAYDKVMYKRAFGWVKASENLRDDRAYTWSGWVRVKALVSILHVVGYGVSLLELLRLKKRVEAAF